MAPTHPLFPAWSNHLAEFALPPDQLAGSFARLVAAYQSPGRHYHTLDHVADVLHTIDQVSDHARDLPAVRLAAWFHDAVYDSRANDNEERSAELAREILVNWPIPARQIDHVERLILATKTHQPDDDPDTAVLMDADLAILGADPDRYDRYAADIRLEYGWVAEPGYRSGRADVLRRFLARPILFHTTVLHALLEKSARENLGREIAQLTG